MRQNKGGTSGMEMAGPLMEEAVLLYFVGIDCATGKGEYWRSGSLTVWTVDANKVLGSELVYGCNNIQRDIQPTNRMIPGSFSSKWNLDQPKYDSTKLFNSLFLWNQLVLFVFTMPTITYIFKVKTMSLLLPSCYGMEQDSASESLLAEEETQYSTAGHFHKDNQAQMKEMHIGLPGQLQGFPVSTILAVKQKDDHNPQQSH